MLCVLKREREAVWVERNMVWVRWALEDLFLSMRGTVVPFWECNRFVLVLTRWRGSANWAKIRECSKYCTLSVLELWCRSAL